MCGRGTNRVDKSTVHSGIQYEIVSTIEMQPFETIYDAIQLVLEVEG